LGISIITIIAIYLLLKRLSQVVITFK